MKKVKTTRRISREVSKETLAADLERYKSLALELGASQAEIIPAQWVEVDERVRLKCLIPRCANYGQCAFCPPYTPEAEPLRQALRRYQWALAVKQDIIPASQLANPNQYERGSAELGKKLQEMLATIELQAFADGYYLSLGLGAGSCKLNLCAGMYCQVLDSGRCRFPLKARPSMEAMGMDVFGLAARLGWEAYPIYAGVDPSLVPCAIHVGVVFIH